MKKAFTIVELLVVMAVIGILITLAVVGIQAVQKSQRETTRVNDVKNMSATLASYYSKYRYYPQSAVASVTGTVIDGTASATENIKYTSPIITLTDSAAVDTSFTLTLSSLGAKVISAPAWGAAGASITCAVGGSEGATTLAPSADQWYIFYRAQTSTPQSYTLASCTENGWSTNFGSKID